jgi:cell division protein FtsQ
MRKTPKKNSRLPRLWDKLRAILERGNPRRIFVGKLGGESTRVIRTAKSAPQRRQKVKTRKRVLVARRKRTAAAVVSVVKLVLLVGASVIVLRSVFHYAHSSPRFTIAHIAVENNTHVPAREIIAYSGIAEGENIFRPSLGESAAAIAEIPWVRDARIQRKLPDEIHITVTERTPFALILSDELFYIDRDRTIIARFDPLESVDAPVITARTLGPLHPGDVVETAGIAEAIDVIGLIKAMRVSDTIRVSEINADNPRNLLLIEETSGASIYLGSNDFKGELWRLIQTAEAVRNDDRFSMADLERMDMRFGAIVPATFRGS